MDQCIKANHKFGNNLRKHRKIRGMTQDQVSTQLQLQGCDISRGSLAKIEAGIRHISLGELKTLKSVLDITYDDIFE